MHLPCPHLFSNAHINFLPTSNPYHIRCPFYSLITHGKMISPSTTNYLTSFASENLYVLLSGYVLSQCPSFTWYITPSIVLYDSIHLGQKILLTSPTLFRIYFGHFKLVLRLEKSYVILPITPIQSAYSPFLPPPCHVYIPLICHPSTNVSIPVLCLQIAP